MKASFPLTLNPNDPESLDVLAWFCAHYLEIAIEAQMFNFQLHYWKSEFYSVDEGVRGSD